MKINSKKKYEACVTVLGMLLDVDPHNDSSMEIAIDRLATAIEEYEAIHYPFPEDRPEGNKNDQFR